nr:putative oxidoreductase yhxc [Quercus suber]
MSEIFTRPSRSLHGRVALISGAGAAGTGIGNGRASAILLAEAGCAVVCVDLDLASAQLTADMIEADGHAAAVAVRADVTQDADCGEAVATAVRVFGRLDVLVNVVGVGGAAGTAVEVDMQAWARDMDINVGSMVRMVKACVPVMARNEGAGGWKGSVVNLSSVAGLRGGTPHLLYPTSKGAIVVCSSSFRGSMGDG